LSISLKLRKYYVNSEKKSVFRFQIDSIKAGGYVNLVNIAVKPHIYHI
jgi:hypothetical protein